MQQACLQNRPGCGQPAREFGYPVMGPVMTRDPSSEDDLLGRAKGGDEQALADLFNRYRDRLRRMLHLRLDRRLQGRIDASDVLQEAFIDFARRFSQFAAAGGMPFYLWLWQIAGQKLIDLHRHAPPVAQRILHIFAFAASGCVRSKVGCMIRDRKASRSTRSLSHEKSCA